MPSRTVLAAAAALALAAAPALAAPPWEGTPLTADPRALLAAARARPAPPGVGLDVLLEESVYRYDARGAVAVEHRTVARVLTAEAARAVARIEQVWSPWHQARPELRARVVTEDGAVHGLDPATLVEHGVREGEPGALHSERRVLAATLPAVAAGAVLEVVTALRDTAPAFDGGAASRVLLAQPTPVHLLRLRVEAPAALPLRLVVRGVDLAPRERVRGGVRSFAIERRAVAPAPPVEPGHPLDFAPAPYVAFGWGRSWADAAERYGALCDRQLAGADLAGPAREALGADRPDRAEAVRRIARWVAQHVRAASLELGEVPLAPATPAETLARGSGDSKDLALLFAGLLRAAGIPARIALVRSGWSETLLELPGLSQLDRALVRVDGEPPIWLDPSDPATPPGRLPPPVEGRLALVAGPGAAGLVRTPESGPETNRLRTVRELHLADAGRGRIVETRELRGALASAERSFRGHLPPDLRAGLEERYAKEVLRGGQLLGASVTGEEDPSAPLRIRVEAGESEVLRTDDDAAEVPVTPDPVFEALPSFVSAVGAGEGAPAADGPPPRRSDLVLSLPYRWDVEYRVFPPEGFRARRLPGGSEERFGPASLLREVSAEKDGSVTVSWRFDTGGRRLAAADADRLTRRIRELLRGEPLTVAFERTSAALLASGQVREALAELSRLVALHPGEPTHHLHLAVAVLGLGFTDAAAAEARRAIALDPDRAGSERVLGWVLEHDAVGRLHGPGFDRAGALAAYRRAGSLDPDHPGGRVALAELLAHAPDGLRHGPGADLVGAIAEYAAIAEDLDDRRFDGGRLDALFAAGRFADAEALARRLPRSPERDATLVAAVAAARGPADADAEARGLGEPRRDALREAARLLVRQRRYPAAAALVEAATDGAAQAAEPAGHFDDLRRLVRWEALVETGSEPERLVRRLVVAALRAGDAPGAVAAALGPLMARTRLAPELVKIAEEGVLATLPAGAARRGLRAAAVPLDVVADMLLSKLEVVADGDPAVALRLRLTLASARDGRAFAFAVRDRGALRVLATDSAWPVLGAEALRRLDAGDAPGARRWLEWAREAVPGAPDRPASPAGMLAALWPAGAAGDEVAARRAAAALLAWADARGRTVPLLTRGRDRASGAERRALGFALAQAQRSAGRARDVLRTAHALLAEDPSSREAFGLVLWAEARLRRPDALAAEAQAFLARTPDDAEARAAAANARLQVGDLDGAARDFRALVDAGQAGPALYNNAAWLELFRSGPTPTAADWARRAVEPARAASHPSLNTLAAVEAAAGRAAEARETFLRSLEAEGGIAPSPSDWFVFGEIAEAWGLPEIARAAYARVAPDAADPTSPHLLALRRAAALGPTPAAPAGVRPARRRPPAAAPAERRGTPPRGPPAPERRKRRDPGSVERPSRAAPV